MRRRIKRYYLIGLDIFTINIAMYIALVLKFGFEIPEACTAFYMSVFIVVSIGKIVIYNYFSLYDSLWEYASIEELIQVVGGVLVSNMFAAVYMFTQKSDIPVTVVINLMMIEVILIGGTRFSYRLMRRMKNHKSIVQQNCDRNVLVVGAGSTAGMIAKEILNHPKAYGHLIGFIDDDLQKDGKSINGKKVLGNRYDIYSIVKRYKINELIIAIPSANKEDRIAIIEECNKTDCVVKTVPGISEIIDGNVSMNEVRDIEIEDLLGRDTVKLEMSSISNYVTDKVVMVTGGGGSIGSELCRQIAKFSPRKLIILDIYENNAYEIQNELIREYGDTLDLHTLIASVRDKKNIRCIFKELRPQVVFHAAAHKHVPLMETAPREAILNNCFGTLNVAQAADEYKAEKFVMISTDKAVNPTNVMGASKKICEMVIQSMARVSKTKFSAVRFGNVLGSNGSVIPLFMKQIKEGGPVTVTHKEIIRYFMTIPEAAQLVLQSGAYAKGGEVFVLDMGNPVSIYKLAEDLIKLSGFEPNEEIDIKITGLRPGEKLYEELLMEEEGMKETPHPKIFIGKAMFVDYKVVLNMLGNLTNVLAQNNDQQLKDQIKLMVPSYRMNNEINKAFIENGCSKDFEEAYRQVN